MNWASGVVLYVMIWMVTLFAVLPIGTQPDADADSKTGWRGAPKHLSMKRKLAITTIIATVLFAIAAATIVNEWLSFRHGILSGR